jgi:hypothetical protein
MDAAATFTIHSSINDYSVDSNFLAFTEFEYVSGGGLNDLFNFVATNTEILEYLGGAGDDVFALIGNILVPGKINGQGGTDTLTYAGFTTSGVLVNLAAGTATAIHNGLAGGLSGIENVIGSIFADTLIGDIWNNLLDGNDGDDLLNGAEGNDELLGGLGSDIFQFLADWGQDIASDLGGVLDQLDFSALETALFFTISMGGINATAGGLAGLTFTGNSIEKIRSGKRDDEFTFDDRAGLTTDNAGITGQIDGGGGTNRLNYAAYTTGVTVDLADFPAFGTATGTGGVINIQDVYGGFGADILFGNALDNVIRGGAGNDILDGRTGVDTLDESNSTFNLSVDLNLTTAQSTGLGSDTITNIENVFTGSGNDTITGSSFNNLLNGGTGNDTYRFLNGYGEDIVNDISGMDTLDFSSITSELTFIFNIDETSIKSGLNLVSSGTEIDFYLGGSSADTFNLNANRTADLYGGSGADGFIFADGITLTGDIDGQADKDTLDWSGNLTARAVILTGTGATDGFNGTESSITGGSFTNIDKIIGSGETDSLQGMNSAAVWNIDSTLYYQVGTHDLIFAQFESLIGNSGIDRFSFHGTTGFTGTLDGDDGTDILDFTSYDLDVTLNLQQMSVTGLSGNFSNIESFVGKETVGNTIIGITAGNVFAVSGKQAGVVNSWFSFTGVDILTGTSGADTLDYTSYVGAATFNLTSIGTTDGFNGTETGSGITFENINTLIGSAYSDSLDGLSGDATWLLSGPNAGQYTSQSRTIEFSSVESIAGDSGTNTLSYSGQTGVVAVTLTGIGTLHGFTGTGTFLTMALNIDNQGGTIPDILTGAKHEPPGGWGWMQSGHYPEYRCIQLAEGRLISQRLKCSSVAVFPIPSH